MLSKLYLLINQKNTEINQHEKLLQEKLKTLQNSSNDTTEEIKNLTDRTNQLKQEKDEHVDRLMKEIEDLHRNEKEVSAQSDSVLPKEEIVK
jgi:uncharacterized protein YoxC